MTAWKTWTPETERPVFGESGLYRGGPNPITNLPEAETPIRAKAGETTLVGLVEDAPASPYPLVHIVVLSPEYPDRPWLGSKLTLWLTTGWTFEIDDTPAEPDILDLADNDLPGMWSQSDFTGGEGAVWSEKHGRYI